MKLCFISDTHNLHKVVHYLEKKRIENVDLLIHAGDISLNGTEAEVSHFIKWLNKFPAKYKVFIGGNHDLHLEKVSLQEMKTKLNKNTFYLNNSGVVIEDIHIWGIPMQSGVNTWTFEKKSGREIRKYWKLIPKKTNILVTHGPPFGILDKTKKGSNAGCKELLRYVKRIKPNYHVFGHIHESYGQLYDGSTHYVNACLLNEKYRLLNEPIILSYNKNSRKNFSLSEFLFGGRFKFKF